MPSPPCPAWWTQCPVKWTRCQRRARPAGTALSRCAMIWKRRMCMATYMAVRRVRGPAWNAGLPLRGQAQWDDHAAFMNALAAEGFVVLGGPLGSGEEILLIIN